ncbi:MAG: V-type ATPase subunit [Clostridiales bacterium]|jgi:V/A-type H+-transporting ATPase subunit C|nr:V-type ATPase subunit [Clostridiales bacterium]
MAGTAYQTAAYQDRRAYHALDYTCAVARIAALETRLLGRGDYEKLLGAATAADAARLLEQFGYKASERFGDLLSDALSALFTLTQSLGGEDFLKIERLKYDYHNLKALVKKELTASEEAGDDLLSDLGGVSVAAMKSAVINREYRGLTDNMKRAAAQVYDQYARLADVQLTDILFDRALLGDMLMYAEKQPEPKILEIIKTRIDLYNIQTFVRVRKMAAADRAREFMRRAVAAGGKIPPGFYLGNIAAPPDGEAAVFERTAYASAFAAGENLERSLDNLLMEQVKTARRGAFGLAPVAAYFWLKENEIRNLRIILTCKNAGIDADAVKRQLRG